MKLIYAEVLTQTIQKRPEHSHKGSYGQVVIIGGNKQYGGAIQLCSAATVYSGAGLTTTVTDVQNHAAVHAMVPETMVLDWNDTKAVTNQLKKATVIVIGPGLGLEQGALSLLSFVLEHLQTKQICIIDGSAITLYAEHKEHLPPHPAQNLIFTPHEMEWQRLSGITIAEQTPEKNRHAQQQLGAQIVLKKHRTEIYTAKQTWKNPLGTPAMATGGMGDTLAGMIAGFYAQFPHHTQTLLAAIYLHSFIAEKIAQTHYVVLPSTLIKEIPLAMKLFESFQETRTSLH